MKGNDYFQEEKRNLIKKLKYEISFRPSTFQALKIQNKVDRDNEIDKEIKSYKEKAFLYYFLTYQNPDFSDPDINILKEEVNQKSIVMQSLFKKLAEIKTYLEMVDINVKDGRPIEHIKPSIIVEKK